jgi:sulfate transport system ATP-binding protein
MDFLGNVNVFHGRVEGGRAVLGGLDLDYPDYPHEQAKPATVFVRPHELEIDRTRPDGSSLPAQVVRINAAGAAAKVELSSNEFGALVNVVISRERLAELELHPGDAVYVFPKQMRVFVQDYSI